MAFVPVSKETKQQSSSTKDLLSRTIQPLIRLPTNRSPPYFWGEGFIKDDTISFPVSRGYVATGQLIGDGSPGRLEEIANTAVKYLNDIYNELDDLHRRGIKSGKFVVEIRLSEELERWRNEQRQAGHMLPSKGFGLVGASTEVIQLLGAEDWAAPLVTNGALWGGGYIDMLNGAYDARTLYSNYCVDMAFYYEHSYHKVFTEFEPIFTEAMDDPYALRTPCGEERRLGAKAGLEYIKAKVALEEKYEAISWHRSARMNLDTALMLMFCESSAWGVAAEALARGWDRAGVANDFAFSAPGTDVVDVGSDHCNSELLNSFLNTGDITDDGVISVEKLRRVYDAFAHSCARLFTERWSEPGARLCSVLYPWHIENSRHWFLRRALLGYSQVRKIKGEQREGDFCEVFSPEFHTTGFSRPLENACNGAEVCDHVQQRLERWREKDLLFGFWWLMSSASIEYVSGGRTSPEREEEIAEGMRVSMAKIYSLGLVDELAWLMAHANHHAWQVNYLFEAAMFGSLLDDESLRGKLDRKNY